MTNSLRQAYSEEDCFKWKVQDTGLHAPRTKLAKFKLEPSQKRMNWLFPSSKGSGPLPPLNSLQQQRQRQIESLKTAHSSLAEIQKDVEYRIPFTVNNSTINVNILLPPQFPQEKPVVSVYPPVGHHLVDSNNGTNVTSPLIANFGMHSDLGKVIHSLLDEFRKSPPVLTGATGFPYNMSKPPWLPPYPTQGFHYSPLPPGPTLGPMPHPVLEAPHAHGSTRAAAPAYGLITDLPVPVPAADLQAGLNGHMYKMPEIPDTFPELSEMSVSQLKDLSEQEDVLLEFFACLPQLKRVTADKEELVNSIVNMASESPFSLHPDGGRCGQYEQLTQNKSAFETKMQRQHELSESCSLSALQARLKVAAHQAEEESEEMAESFLEGKSEIDDFLANFMEKRTLCHSRRAKEEKLQQSINMHGQFPSSH
uniref:VPS37 C-terminal domain-containing protein n=1 Tax=Esox lucius TaxID=8010 RepID=A0AAY5K1T5_ESOLU